MDTFEPEGEKIGAGLQMKINQIERELIVMRKHIAGYLKELGING